MLNMSTLMHHIVFVLYFSVVVYICKQQKFNKVLKF